MTKIKAEDAKAGQWCENGDGCRLLCVDGTLFVFRNGVSIRLVGSVLLTHLPLCTGWDWQPEPTYAELHAKCGLKVGDRVRVVSETNPVGWVVCWGWLHSAAIGRDGKIVNEQTNRDGGHPGFCVEWKGDNGSVNGAWFPCTSLEKVDPRYRPFQTWQEWWPHRDRWVRVRGDRTRTAWLGATYAKRNFNDGGVFLNDDGTDAEPFGVEVKE